MAAGDADVDRCPPGGAEGVRRLSQATGRQIRPLDAECGQEGPRRLARVDEAACIGCALCLPACPVDAIVGAARHLHVVIGAHCTGCELCLPACPVDCIVMVDGPTGARTGWDAWSPAEADRARARHAAHVARAARAGPEAA
jgi:electron transport complex protein RnfB